MYTHETKKTIIHSHVSDGVMTTEGYQGRKSNLVRKIGAIRAAQCTVVGTISYAKTFLSSNLLGYWHLSIRSLHALPVPAWREATLPVDM